MSLAFVKAESQEDYKAIYNYNTDAFSDSPDFHWNLDDIKKEVKDGWELYSAKIEKEVVAAVFVKLDGENLLSKHTSIKVDHQGSGYSHQIKEFVEEVAIGKGAKKVMNYCRIDNFRQYSLNESHGYHKTPHTFSDGLVVEWEKNIK